MIRFKPSNLCLLYFFLALCLFSMISITYHVIQDGVRQTSFRTKYQKVELFTEKGYLRSTSALQNPNDDMSVRKIILLWEKSFWFKSEQVASPPHCGTCALTTNRSLLSDDDTKAVVFDVSSDAYRSLSDHEKRRGDQLYVFWTMESPGRTQKFEEKKIDLKLFPDHFFNATMTFRRDSTFYTQPSCSNLVRFPTGKLVSPADQSTSYILAKKKRTAVWFVSNCYSGSNAKRRLKLADDMIKNGLKLDRYGKCFKDTHFTGDKLDFQRFVQTYKFYLAFENSLHCRDYITEKFFVNGLTVGTVPVVYGALRKDYEAIAPPHSFIHVEDFNTTKELVDYLNYLDKNQTAYAEYFAWRDKNPHAAYQCWDYTGFCALCRSLYGIATNDKRPFWEIYGEKGERYNVSTAAVLHQQSIRSIHEWWHVNESKDCMNDV